MEGTRRALRVGFLSYANHAALEDGGAGAIFIRAVQNFIHSTIPRKLLCACMGQFCAVEAAMLPISIGELTGSFAAC